MAIAKESKKRTIRIKLKAFDPALLEKATKSIVNVAKTTGASLKGPVPFPVKHEIFTVLRSPHVDKKSREQFEMRTHTRVIIMENPTSKTIDRLRQTDISAGVEVKISM